MQAVSLPSPLEAGEHARPQLGLKPSEAFIDPPARLGPAEGVGDIDGDDAVHAVR